jgi:predicted lipoprotein with Yx(FWY)xxD motif
MRLKSRIAIAASTAAVAAVVVISGCGGGGSGSQATAMGGGAAGGSNAAGATKAAAQTGESTSVVDLRSTDLGKILVNGQGRTLYLFEADKPNMSNCSGACSTIWSPYDASGMAKAGSGVAASKIGSTAQGQVTYNGHPLYTYVGDQKPGDTSGQNLDQFGAEWYVLSASGNKVDNG